MPGLLSHNMPTLRTVLPAFRDLTPHPQYAAFYKWLQQDFQADAVVHFGMHGTVEWLPGAPLGEAPTLPTILPPSPPPPHSPCHSGLCPLLVLPLPTSRNSPVPLHRNPYCPLHSPTSPCTFTPHLPHTPQPPIPHKPCFPNACTHLMRLFQSIAAVRPTRSLMEPPLAFVMIKQWQRKRNSARILQILICSGGFGVLLVRLVALHDRVVLLSGVCGS